MKLIDKDALIAEIKKRYEYWREKEHNSHSIESEARMSECQYLMLLLNTLEVKEVDLEKEAGYSKPASKDFTFKSIPRILEMVKPSERAKSYCEKLAKSLENEGYPTDAKIVKESIKMMNGEEVPMATMDEEPVSEDLEEASKEWLRPQLDMSYINYGEGKMMELTHFDGYAMLDAIEFGAQWQQEQMMKDAINAEVAVPVYEGKDIKLTQLVTTDVKLNVGDKVKLVLIKSE